MKRTTIQRPVTVVLVVLVLASAGAPAAGATPSQATKPSFIVDLNDDGSARLTLTLTYDLSTESERAAFEEIETNESAREQARTAFRERMRQVASDAENETGREMAIANARIKLATANDGSTGVIRLHVTYDGLAAVDDGRLRVTAPFSSGFDPDRRFVVTGPEGYEVASASPNPVDQNSTSVAYAAGTDLSGFEVQFAPADGTTRTGQTNQNASETAIPGFGIGTALAALFVILGVGLLGRRLQS